MAARHGQWLVPVHALLVRGWVGYLGPAAVLGARVALAAGVGVVRVAGFALGLTWRALGCLSMVGGLLFLGVVVALVVALVGL